MSDLPKVALMISEMAIVVELSVYSQHRSKVPSSMRF
jgi:hypothetical protein